MRYISKRYVKISLLSLLAVLLLVVIGFVLVNGPWPAYVDSRYADTVFFNQTLKRIDEHLVRPELTEAPGRLLAGWAEQDMTPPVGTPMAGYSGRPTEKRCTAIHDPVFARAIVLSDGRDTVALVGSDMLMTTQNLAEQVWARVATETVLTSDTILFTTSHNHSGPGAFAPGLLPEFSYGKYDPAVEERIVSAVADAIIAAYKAMAPAKIAHGVWTLQFIENRTGMPGKDASLRFLVIENDAGQRCQAALLGASHGASAGIPGSFCRVSGALCRRIMEETGAMTVFWAGPWGQ